MVLMSKIYIYISALRSWWEGGTTPTHAVSLKQTSAGESTAAAGDANPAASEMERREWCGAQTGRDFVFMRKSFSLCCS